MENKDTSFAISISGRHYWVADRGLTIAELRSGSVNTTTDGSEGSLDSCFKYDEALLRVHVGDETHVLLESGQLRCVDVKVDVRECAYSKEIPIVRTIQENSGEDWSDEVHVQSGFDPSLLCIETDEIEVENAPVRVVVGCSYDGVRLMFSGIDNTQSEFRSEGVRWNGRMYGFESDGKVSAEILKGAVATHVRSLTMLCKIDGVSYYGSWEESLDSLLKQICISAPDNVFCDFSGCYLCSKILMPDGITSVADVYHSDVIETNVFFYDTINGKVFANRR